MSGNRESMIEKVARAICWKDGRVHPDIRGLDGNPCWMSFERHARAAIEAMREPTPEMIAEAEAGHYDSEYLPAWNAMIAAALSENEGSAPTSPDD